MSKKIIFNKSIGINSNMVINCDCEEKLNEWYNLLMVDIQMIKNSDNNSYDREKALSFQNTLLKIIRNRIGLVAKTKKAKNNESVSEKLSKQKDKIKQLSLSASNSKKKVQLQCSITDYFHDELAKIVGDEKIEEHHNVAKLIRDELTLLNDIKPDLDYTVIKTESQYSAYLERLSELMNNCELNTPEGDELELLGLLIKDYDNRAHPIPELSWFTKLMFKIGIYKK